MRILAAEDDPASRRLLEAFLTKWGYEVVVATHGDEAWQVLQRDDSPRLAILDWMMPGMDGVEVCRAVRKRKPEPYIYLLLLTAKGHKRDIVEGLEAGADDYLTKPFDPYELRARLRAGRRVIELQEQLLSAQNALQEQALHDPLTELWNRRGILRLLRQELDRAFREESSVAVAMVDIDHFKAINDTYGHMAGDAVLREVARRLRSAVRTYDAIGRYGGDEFLTVLSKCGSSGAASLSESFRARMNRKAVDTSEGMIPVTLSLGVVVSSGAVDPTPDGLIRAADTALYRAKAAGRNRVEIATPQEVSTAPGVAAPADSGPPKGQARSESP